VNVNRVKAVTFGVSAFFMGLTGATMCMRWSYIDPTTAFSIQYSFMPVLMAIFGGMGHLYGPVLGATIFSLLEELLTTKFPYYYMLIFGLTAWKGLSRSGERGEGKQPGMPSATRRGDEHTRG
jgi:branched-chain amino acid transport system permease protein